jgi:hypothetical protein
VTGLKAWDATALLFFLIFSPWRPQAPPFHKLFFDFRRFFALFMFFSGVLFFRDWI